MWLSEVGNTCHDKHCCTCCPLCYPETSPVITVVEAHIEKAAEGINDREINKEAEAVVHALEYLLECIKKPKQR